MRHPFSMMIWASTLAACAAPGSIFYRPSPAEIAEANKTPDEQFNDRWTGHPEDDILLRYGKPNDIIQLASGNKIYSYHSEFTQSGARGFANQYAGAMRSDTVTIYCDRRFEIDVRTATVFRASISGNRCDYNR